MHSRWQCSLCSCFISSPKLMFHFDLCCHLRCCKSYFVWHEWDIFCLIKFKLCRSVRFCLVWHTLCDAIFCVDGGSVFLYGSRFQCNVFVSVFFALPPFLFHLHLSRCYSYGPCLENTLHKCKQRKTYVWCQCKHRIVINYTDKIISETFCHAVFLSNCFVDCGHRGRRRRSDLSHYYSLSNLIELLWYITFRFA